MEDSKKKILVIISFGVLLTSGLQKFVTISGLESIPTFQIKGFLIALVAFPFLFYGMATKKKFVLFISYIVGLFGYGYTIYTLYSIYDKTITLELGSYMYAASFLFFLLSVFVKVSKKEISKEEQALKNSVKDTGKPSVSYIYGTYLFGINDTQAYSNHQCAITTNQNNNLLIILSNEQTASFEIMNSQIEKITITRSLSLKKNKEDPALNATEDRMLGYAQGGAIGMMVADNADVRDDAGKIKYEAAYLTEINYLLNGESKKIMLELKNNPDRIFKSFGERYEKKA